ncbi:hypothetical protein Goshw_022137 [Gossypium schwendimanii]|nr:hypothetical protein [Gossypium schwendimanii]
MKQSLIYSTGSIRRLHRFQ